MGPGGAAIPQACRVGAWRGLRSGGPGRVGIRVSFYLKTVFILIQVFSLNHTFALKKKYVIKY
jgi:hypothetical protein